MSRLDGSGEFIDGLPILGPEEWEETPDISMIPIIDNDDNDTTLPLYHPEAEGKKTWKRKVTKWGGAIVGSYFLLHGIGEAVPTYFLPGDLSPGFFDYPMDAIKSIGIILQGD